MTHPERATGDLAARFERHRAVLVRHAYRMLGEHGTAEDTVQDAFLRYRDAAAHAAITDDLAFLRTTTTRLCIDRLRSLRTRRETYVGPWLPEPVVAAGDDDPATALAFADDVSFALLLALERLTPLERAAFLLHDVMGVAFAEIGVTLGRSDEACRRLASRARTHVRAPIVRAKEATGEIRRLRDALARAIARDDLAALRSLLAQDVVFVADSGGNVTAARIPVRGDDRVARLLLGLVHKYGAGRRFHDATINGAAGYVMRAGEVVEQTMSFEVGDGRIVAIYTTRNPDKLRRITR